MGAFANHHPAAHRTANNFAPLINRFAAFQR
jgi:hypothetical protein